MRLDREEQPFQPFFVCGGRLLDAVDDFVLKKDERQIVPRFKLIKQPADPLPHFIEATAAGHAGGKVNRQDQVRAATGRPLNRASLDADLQ